MLGSGLEATFDTAASVAGSLEPSAAAILRGNGQRLPHKVRTERQRPNRSTNGPNDRPALRSAAPSIPLGVIVSRFAVTLTSP
jgi:hypothetical protein